MEMEETSLPFCVPSEQSFLDGERRRVEKNKRIERKREREREREREQRERE